MPFTAPGTYPSQANTGYYAQMLIGIPSSPLSYNALIELKSIKPAYFTIPEVPTTHLLSPNYTEEFFPGMLKPGAIDITGNFVPTGTGAGGDQLNFTTLAQAQAIIEWKIIAPVLKNTKTYTALGTGFVTEYSPGPFENNKAVEFTAKIQITSTYSESVA